MRLWSGVRGGTLHVVARATACAVVIAACGSSASPARCRAVPSASPPQVTAARLVASADAASAQPGSTVAFTVVTWGPTRYEAPCDGPLQLVVEDQTTLSVYSSASTAGPASACGDVTLASGVREVYDVAWAVDPTQPRGLYRARLLLGDLPPITLPVRVGGNAAVC